MPFDNAGYVALDVKPTTLADLGLTAIAPERAEQWKKFMFQRYARFSATRQRNIDRGLVRFLDYHCSMRSLESQTRILARTGAPRDVHALVRKLTNAFPRAEARVEVFDTDPLLSIHLDGAWHYVAIWDRRVVRAIADGHNISNLQRALRKTLFKTV